MRRWLPTSKRGLWAAFFVFLALNVVFAVVMRVYGFAIIDEMWRPADILAHVDAMSAPQRRAHAWLTATVDVAYPLAYAALFGGLAVGAFPNRAWLALPIVLCVPFDLAEGLSQMMILGGHAEWVAVKAVATPIKLVLFVAGVLTGLAGLVALVRQRKRPAA